MAENKVLPLGSDLITEIKEGKENIINLSLENRVDLLENKIADLRTLVTHVLQLVKDQGFAKENENSKPIKIGSKQNISEPEQKNKYENIDLNKDGIPINTILMGVVNGTPHVLYVNRNYYTVGRYNYDSLSAAAKAITGKRRNGWEFWKTPSGERIGDTITVPVYKKNSDNKDLYYEQAR